MSIIFGSSTKWLRYCLEMCLHGWTNIALFGTSNASTACTNQQTSASSIETRMVDASRIASLILRTRGKQMRCRARDAHCAGRTESSFWCERHGRNKTTLREDLHSGRLTQPCLDADNEACRNHRCALDAIIFVRLTQSYVEPRRLWQSSLRLGRNHLWTVGVTV